MVLATETNIGLLDAYLMGALWKTIWNVFPVLSSYSSNSELSFSITIFVFLFLELKERT